jgi:hypothetical protein
MKNPIEFMNPINSSKGLSKQMKKLIISWALEAHKLDSSKTVRQYYNMFLNRLRQRFKDSKNKDEFYQKEILEK